MRSVVSNPVDAVGGGIDIGCKVGSSTPTTVAPNTPTACIFDTEVYDTDGMHSNVTNNSRITFNRAGKYTVGAGVWMNNPAATFGVYRSLAIRLTPAAGGGPFIIAEEVVRPVADSARNNEMCVTVEGSFQAGDYVQVILNQDSGSDRSVVVSGQASPFFFARKDDAAG